MLPNPRLEPTALRAATWPAKPGPLALARRLTRPVGRLYIEKVVPEAIIAGREKVELSMAANTFRDTQSAWHNFL
jgi:hypothetical protein